MPSYNAGSATVTISPNLSGFATDLKSELERIHAETPVTVIPDTTGFAQKLQARLEQITAEVPVGVNVDTNAAEAKILRLTRDRTVHLNLDVDRRGLDNLGGSGGMGLLLDALGAVGGGGAISTASASIGGFGGLSSALTGASSQLNTAATGAAGKLTAAGSSLGGATAGLATSGSTLGSIASGAAGGIGSFATSLGLIVTLAPLVIGAVGSIGTGIAALGGIAVPTIGAVILGAHGIGDAFSTAAAAESAAGKDAETAAKTQQTALRAVESAQRQVESAQRSVISAQKSYGDAVRDEKRAQDDVATARKDAREQLEDLQLTLRGAAISERDAVLGLARARRNLAELGAGGKPVDLLDRDEALNRVEQAEQRLLEVQERNKDLRDKATQDQAKGVEKSDVVVAAQDRLVAAQDKVKDASDRISQANQQVAVSQQALGDAQQSLVDAQTKTSSTADAAAQAMAALSPAAQAFVVAMRALNAEGGAWNVFQQSVQEGLFTGLTADVEKLANTLLPAITPAMSNIGSSIAGLFGVFTEAMTSDKGVGQLTRFLDSIPKFFDAMAPGIQAMVDGFLAFGDAIAPVAGQLGGAFGQVLGAIGDTFTQLAASGKLTETISGFAQALSGLADLAGPLVNMFVTIGATVGPIMGQFFTDLGRVVQDMTPTLDDLAHAVGDALIQMFQTLAPILPKLVEAFSGLVIALVPFLPQLLKMGTELLPPLIEKFIAAAPALADLTGGVIVILGYMPQLVDVLMSLQNPTKAIAGWFTDLATKVKEDWNGIVDVIKKSIGKIGEIIKSMGDAMPGAIGSSLSVLGESMMKWSTTIGTTVPTAAPRPPGFIGPVAVRAGGGVLSGPGTGTSDSIPMLGSAGEYVVNARSTAEHLPLLEAINSGTILRRADGGIVSSDGLVSFAKGVEGKPYVWGGVNWGDCSGAMSALSNYVSGRSPFASRFATMTEGSELAARGATSGLGPAGSLSFGWYNGGPYGGHTAGTLPNGVNVEMGGARGNGQYGGQAVGANWSQFTDHAFFPAAMFRAPWGNEGIYYNRPGGGAPGGDYGTFNPGQQYGPEMLGAGYEQSWQQAGSYGAKGADEKITLQYYGSKAGELAANWLLGAFGLENSILSSSNVLKNVQPGAAPQPLMPSTQGSVYARPSDQTIAKDRKLGDPLHTPTGVIPAMAGGGWITGPGGPRDDLVPLYGSDGEFMVHAAAAAQHGPLLEAINAGGISSRPMLPAGGYRSAGSGSTTHDRSINYGDVITADPREFFDLQEKAVAAHTLAQLTAWGG